MAFGLTPQGFVPMVQTDIEDAIDTDVQSTLQASIDLTDNSYLGKFKAIIAAQLALVWAQAEELNAARDPDNAVGADLVELSGVTGTIPLGALASVVTELLYGVSTTLVPEGTTISVPGRADGGFLTANAVTLAVAPTWSYTTTYAVGDIRKNGGKLFLCTQGGLGSNTGAGPTGVGAGIIDGTVVWRGLGTGDGYANVSMASFAQDAITAPAFQLTSINTPVVGLNGAINLLDAQVGRPAETDTALRAQREQELRRQGASSVEAIRERVAAVNGVASVAGFENDTDVVDANGLPPKSINMVVRYNAGPPANVGDLIRQAIYQSKAGGIQSFGTSVTGTVTDSQGQPQEIDYDVLAELDAYIRATWTTIDGYPLDGDNQVAAAILALQDSKLGSGYDLVASQVVTAIGSVPGVFEVTNVQVGLTTPVSGTRVVATPRQQVVLDSSRLNLSSSVEPSP